MSQPLQPPETVLLTVRGTPAVPTTESARTLHNETAGSAPGMAAARALGDLSHAVYLPASGAGQSGAGELLFVDVWEDPAGLMSFFSNKNVQEQGGRLFTARDPVVWMPAQGAFTFHLDPPAARHERHLGMLRAQVTSPQAAMEAFRGLVRGHLRDARRRGQISHDLYFRLPAPGESGPPELLGLDLWSDANGMEEHYRETMSGLGNIFAGAPATSVWRRATEQWNQW